MSVLTTAWIGEVAFFSFLEKRSVVGKPWQVEYQAGSSILDQLHWCSDRDGAAGEGTVQAGDDKHL